MSSSEIRPVPYNGPKSYLFVSYAHRDTQRVYLILDRMISMGLRIWFDESVTPGSLWDEHIAGQVKNSDAMIAFISANYLQSDNCRDELNYARDLKKNLLLIYLEQADLPDGMAMRLNRLQAIYMDKFDRQEDFYAKLLECDFVARNRDEDFEEGDMDQEELFSPGRQYMTGDGAEYAVSLSSGSGSEQRSPNQSTQSAGKTENVQNDLISIRESMEQSGIKLYALAGNYIASQTIVSVVNIHDRIRFCILVSYDGREYAAGKKIPIREIPISSVTDARMFKNQIIIQNNAQFAYFDLSGNQVSTSKIPVIGRRIKKVRSREYALKNEYVTLYEDGTIEASTTQGNNINLSRTGDNKRFVDFAMCNEHFIALLDDGTVEGKLLIPDQDYGQCDVDGWKEIKKVCVRQYLSVGLMKNGTVVYAGKKEDDELKTWRNVVDIASSDVYVIGLTEDGRVLGTHSYTKVLSSWNHIVQISISDDHMVTGLRDDGMVLIYLRGSTIEVPLATDYELSGNTQDDPDFSEEYKKLGLCQYCGGRFSGFFTKTCTQCGRRKDY